MVLCGIFGLLLGILANEVANMPDLFSYIVVYDSGFAPNPFHDFCTLATCKPKIRKGASVGDWVVGTGSKGLGLRGFFVYAMRVSESLSFAKYWNDPRFEKKKPNLHGSYKIACGDNIYYPLEGGQWGQLNSYHSEKDGSPNQKHIDRDTEVNRVLISNDFVYFGGKGRKVPDSLGKLVHQGRGYKRIKDQAIIMEFESWLQELGMKGYQGRPFDMIEEARNRERKRKCK